MNFSPFTAMNARVSPKDQLQSVSDNLCISFVTSRADFLPCHQRAGVYTLRAKTHRTGVLNSKFCPFEFEAQPLAADCVSHLQAHAAPPEAALGSTASLCTARSNPDSKGSFGQDMPLPQ